MSRYGRHGRFGFRPRDCWLCGSPITKREEGLWIFPQDLNGICLNHGDLKPYDIELPANTEITIKYVKFVFDGREYKRKFEAWRVKQFLEKIGRGLIAS